MRGGLNLFDLRDGCACWHGIEIELDKVPQRAPNMSQLRDHVSESQERMLIVVHKAAKRK